VTKHLFCGDVHAMLACCSPTEKITNVDKVAWSDALQKKASQIESAHVLYHHDASSFQEQIDNQGAKSLDRKLRL
jgi:hypothetical protein